MRRFHERLLIALMVCALACSAAWAQGTGQINGLVKDQSGAVLPGAEVTVNPNRDRRGSHECFE